VILPVLHNISFSVPQKSR